MSSSDLSTARPAVPGSISGSSKTKSANASSVSLAPSASKTKTKTARACVHCHKSHMTCDSSRPCKRCVSRGLADSCVDAPRKKKKYLMDIDDQRLAIAQDSVSPPPDGSYVSSAPLSSNSTTVNSNFHQTLPAAGPADQTQNHQFYNVPPLDPNSSLFSKPNFNDLQNTRKDINQPNQQFASSNQAALLPIGHSLSSVSFPNLFSNTSVPNDPSFNNSVGSPLNAKDMSNPSITASSMSPHNSLQMNNNLSLVGKDENTNTIEKDNQPAQLKKKRPSRFSSAAADLEYAVLTNIIRENPEPLFNNDGSWNMLNSVSMSESNSVQNSSQQSYNQFVPNFLNFSNHSNQQNSIENYNSYTNNHSMQTTNSPYSDTPTPPHTGSPPHKYYSLFANRELARSNHHYHPHHPHHGSHNFPYQGMGYDNGVSHHQHPLHQQQHPPPHPVSNNDTTSSYNLYPQWDPLINQYFLGPLPGLPEHKPYLTYPDILDAIKVNTEKEQKGPVVKDKTKLTLSFAIGVHSDGNSHNFHHNNELLSAQWGLKFKEPEEIYTQVKSPFLYTTGFHMLVLYLRKRFHDDKTVLVKLAKSMAEYRPSFTAQVMSLKEEDLIFMEQCFQRTLLEYNKYLSISGTPTIIWRRTGQISFVSQEFVMLTGWTSEMLLSKITFLVELMDDESVIKYFELFSKIAYGDTTGAGTCDFALVNPTRDKSIKTKSIWTLKRDVFGIPMMIIGNFLPILD